MSCCSCPFESFYDFAITSCVAERMKGKQRHKQAAHFWILLTYLLTKQRQCVCVCVQQFAFQLIKLTWMQTRTLHFDACEAAQWWRSDMVLQAWWAVLSCFCCQYKNNYIYKNIYTYFIYIKICIYLYTYMYIYKHITSINIYTDMCVCIYQMSN